MGATLRLRPHWLPSLALLLLLPLFVQAGLWQLDRAGQRVALADLAQQRYRLPPIDLSETIDREQTLYRRAIARGQWEPQGRILLENRKRDGRVGAHILLPLRLEGSATRVMVNTGWTAQDAATPPPPPVAGLVARPQVPPIRLGADRDWGDRWPYLDTERLAAIRGYPVAPIVLIEEPRLIEETLANADQRDKKSMHIGYAIQWFAFALIAAVGWLFLSLERRKHA